VDDAVSMGHVTTLRAAEDHVTGMMSEVQRFLVGTSMTDMAVCVVEAQTMYTIR
jgi:hypothetical protein